VETLHALHSFEPSGWPDAFLARENRAALYAQARAASLPVLHPVVRTHPVTGRKILHVNPEFTTKSKAARLLHRVTFGEDNAFPQGA
jgi:taurine dioxygenase